MTESQIPITGNEPSSQAAGGRARRRGPSKGKAAPRPKAARRPTAAAKRKPAAASLPAARSGDLQGMLRSFASRASAARGRFTSVSSEGAQFTRRAWQKVSGASRRTIDRLASEWKQMDTAKKAQVLAALLSALAAASTPIVRRGFKKR